MASVPTVEECMEFAEQHDSVYPPELFEVAYRAEVSLQALTNVVSPYTDPLAQALLRRVLRSTAMKAVQLGLITGTGDGNVGVGRVAGLDREVQRLEAPTRKYSNRVF